MHLFKMYFHFYIIYLFIFKQINLFEINKKIVNIWYLKVFLFIWISIEWMNEWMNEWMFWGIFLDMTVEI